MRKTLIIGTLDYNGNGRRNYTASVEWELSDDGRFSMCGNIYHTATRSLRSCGQNLEEIAKAFPHHAKLQRMVSVWREWHLNDMQAGTPAQMAHLKANPVNAGYRESHYVKASEALAHAGLNPDPANGYRYGSGWLKAEIPADIIAEIRSW
jgi:hypothetical protein